MATKPAATDTQQGAPQPAAQQPATPSHGGSYVVDEQTGEHTLVERTQQQGETSPQ